MSTSILPRVVGLVHDEGPFYAAHSLIGELLGDETNVVWLSRPVLTDPGMRWATDDEVTTEHVTLDTLAVADVLFCSGLNTAAELDDDELRTALDRTLAVYRCHLERCRARHEVEAGDYPAETARRYAWCITCAARLLGVEA